MWFVANTASNNPPCSGKFVVFTENGISSGSISYQSSGEIAKLATSSHKKAIETSEEKNSGGICNERHATNIYKGTSEKGPTSEKIPKVPSPVVIIRRFYYISLLN